MSVTQNTLIGKSRGSTGNVTFTSWKGINVIKAKAISVANPRTQGQVNQRQMFSNYVEIFRLNSAIFNAGFKQMAVRQSAFNAATSANLTNGSISTALSPQIADFAILQVSKGSLYYTPINSVVYNVAAGTMTVAWPTDVVADQLGTDKAYISVYGVDGIPRTSSLGGPNRSAGSVTITGIPDTYPASSIFVYLFFVQTGTGKVSDNAFEVGTKS